MGGPEVIAAKQLLERPAREVAALIARNWRRLTDPAATSSAVASLLGLHPLPKRRTGATAAPAPVTDANTDEVLLPCR